MRSNTFVLLTAWSVVACSERPARREDHEALDAAIDGGGEGDPDAAAAADAVAREEADGALDTDGGRPVSYDAGPYCSGADASLPAVVDAGCDAPCVQAACSNGVRDHFETDVDCGGGCKPCSAGQRCSQPQDCETLACASVACAGISNDCEPRQCMATPPAQSELQNLSVSAIARDPKSGALYASLLGYQSSPGAVVAYEPGSLTPSFAIALPGPGGELAVTDDGSALYVGIDGASPGVVRVDLAKRVAGAPFALGSYFTSTVYAQRLATLPGRPDWIGVVGGQVGAASGQVGLHLYRDGVVQFDPTNRSWQTNADLRSLQASLAVFASPERAYTFNAISSGADFAPVDVSPSGLRATARYSDIVPEFTTRARIVGGKLFAGAVVADPAIPRVLGRFYGRGPVAVTDDAARAYLTVIPDAPVTAPLTISCFDVDSFVMTGSVALDTSVSPTPFSNEVLSLELWGDDGIALVLGSQTGSRRLILAPHALRDAPGCHPRGPAATPPALLTAPDARDPWIQTYYLSLSEAAYAPAQGTLYASVAQRDQRFPNRLVAIRVDGTGLAFAPWVGSDPGPLALADDASRAWVGLKASPQLVPVDLHTGDALPGFATELDADARAGYAYGLTVLSGAPDAVATGCTGYTSSTAPVGIYDDGQPRFPRGTSNAMERVVQARSLVSAGPDRLYVTDGTALAAVDLTSSGVAVDWELPPALQPLTLASGSLFDARSWIVDAAAHRLLGTLPDDLLAIAPNAQHAYGAQRLRDAPAGSVRIELSCFDTRTFARSGTITMDVPDPQRRVERGAVRVGMLGDSGVYLLTSDALVLAPYALNCVPGCAPDAPPPPVAPLTAPDAQDDATGLIAYNALKMGEMARQPGSGELFVSVRQTDPRQPNRVLRVAADGAVRSAIPVGSDPGPIAFDDDGAKLFVGLAGAAQVVTLDPATERVTPWLELPPTGSHYPSPIALAIAPGPAGTLAIASAQLGGTLGAGVLVVRADQRIDLSTYPNLAEVPVDTMAFTDDHTLWFQSGFYRRTVIAADGTFTTINAPSTPAFFDRLTRVGNRIVTDAGDVLDGATGARIGSVAVGAVAASASHTGILVATRVSAYTTHAFALHCYDLATLQELGSAPLDVPSGFASGSSNPLQLERLGTEGVAVRTGNDVLMLYPKALLGLTACR